MGCPMCLRKSGDSSGGGLSKTLAFVLYKDVDSRKKETVYLQKKGFWGFGDFFFPLYLFSVEELRNNQLILEMCRKKF